MQDQEITPIPNPTTFIAIERQSKDKIIDVEMFELENTQQPSKVPNAKNIIVYPLMDNCHTVLTCWPCMTSVPFHGPAGLMKKD